MAAAESDRQIGYEPSLHDRDIVFESKDGECGFLAIDIANVDANPEFERAKNLVINCGRCGVTTSMPRENMAVLVGRHSEDVDAVRDQCGSFQY